MSSWDPRDIEAYRAEKALLESSTVIDTVVDVMTGYHAETRAMQAKYAADEDRYGKRLAQQSEAQARSIELVAWLIRNRLRTDGSNPGVIELFDGLSSRVDEYNNQQGEVA